MNEEIFESKTRILCDFFRVIRRIFSIFFLAYVGFSYATSAFDGNESEKLIDNIEFAYDSFVMNIKNDWPRVRAEIENSVRANANPNAVKPDLNYSALEVAALYEDYSLMYFLVRKGSSLEGHREPIWKGTPLLQSAARGQTDIVALLLAYGANVPLS